MNPAVWKPVQFLVNQVRRACDWVEFWIRVTRNKPLYFDLRSEREGVPIGSELKVRHMALHDMKEWACYWELTSLVLRDGKRDLVNGFQILKSEPVPGTEGNLIDTTIQPCRV